MTYGLGRMALVATDPPPASVDPIMGGSADPTYLAPSVTTTYTDLPPPDVIQALSVDPRQVPQQLPDLTVVEPRSLLPLLAVLVGLYALSRGRGRGSQSWGGP